MTLKEASQLLRQPITLDQHGRQEIRFQTTRRNYRVFVNVDGDVYVEGKAHPDSTHPVWGRGKCRDVWKLKPSASYLRSIS